MEDEEEILKAKIAALSSRIDRHKAETGGSPFAVASPPRKPYGRSHLRPRAPYYQLIFPLQDYSHHSWQPQRGAPYGAPYSGRGTYTTKPSLPHRNRTLVIKNTSEMTNSGGGGANPRGWVTKSDRHLQLINNNVYEKKVQDRVQALEETRQKKEAIRAQREMAKVISHQSSASRGITMTAHVITIEGVRFVVADGGNKLIKVNDGMNELHPTPKHADVSGVSFIRSKNGNLYRAGLIKAQRLGRNSTGRYQDSGFTDTTPCRQKSGISKIQKPCLQFSTTGTCSKGPGCRYTHDHNKVAMCKEYLQKGECRFGDHCNLSHEPTAERVPACLHFLRGSCTNDQCRYAHVVVNPGAPVCKAFALYGFCPTGISCEQRHVHECPDYANKGFCRNTSCHLPHVDRASQLRKAAAIGSSDEDAGSDFSSEEEVDDDIDSDEFELLRGQGSDHDLAQQSDYVTL